jgi:hypothetical protein
VAVADRSVGQSQAHLYADATEKGLSEALVTNVFADGDTTSPIGALPDGMPSMPHEFKTCILQRTDYDALKITHSISRPDAFVLIANQRVAKIFFSVMAMPCFHDLKRRWHNDEAGQEQKCRYPHTDRNPCPSVFDQHAVAPNAEILRSWIGLFDPDTDRESQNYRGNF